jgi:hypothetical protein
MNRGQDKAEREKIEKERIYEMFRPYSIGSLHMTTIDRGNGPSRPLLTRLESITPDHDVILYAGEPASQTRLDIGKIGGYSSILSTKPLP